MSAVTGMSRTPADGRFSILPLREHIAQSIGDILSTPIGTRVMRPEYGSRMPRLLDMPMNQAWKLEVYVSVTEALRKWEPRITVRQVRVPSAGIGYADIEVVYELKTNGETATASVRIAR
jgi:phage baseplate assembly protein W